MKTIGIIIRETSINNNAYLGVRKDVFDSLKQLNVNTIGIPITNSFEQIKESIKLCNGIILSGGKTLSENDLLIVDYLYQNNIPTLGICLGMQAMAECYNNQQEQKVENHNSTQEYVHNITIPKDSLLYQIIQKEQIKVNSRHNYSIPQTTFKVNALSTDNVIEGIEDQSKLFFLGVQWHPESLNDQNTHRLFAYFINKL